MWTDRSFSKNFISLTRSHIKKAVYPFQFNTGYKAFILMYHRVSNFKQGEEATSFETGVTADNFEIQIKHFKEEMNPIPLDEMVSYLKKGKRLPKKSIAITFDDGYANNYRIAYPILKKYDIPATIYIVSGTIEPSKMFWWDKIGEMLKTTKKDLLTLDFLKEFIPEETWASQSQTTLFLRDASERDQAQQIVCGLLNKIGLSNIDHAVERIQDQLDVQSMEFAFECHRTLSWQEITEMTGNGISFGAHTITHPNLTMLSLSEAKQEIIESKKRIEDQIGKPVVSFAYPYGKLGHFNRDIIRIVRESGFQYACTAVPGTVSSRSNMYELCRVGMGNLPLPNVIENINNCLYL